MFSTCILVVALAASPMTSPGEVVAVGDHFKIVSDLADTEISRQSVEQALEVAEEAWEQVGRWVDVPEALDAPLVINLFGEVVAYEAAEAELTNGRFKRNLSFAAFETKAAYIALQPALNVEGLERLGLPRQTERLVAHEATHLVVYAVVPSFADHPNWFAEGLSCHIAEAVMVARTGVDSGSQLPHYSEVFSTVRGLAEQGRLPGTREMFLDDYDGLTWAEGYAVQNVFFDFLASKRNARKLKKALVELQGLGGGINFANRLTEKLEKVLGSKAFSKLDVGYEKYVKKLDPEWVQVFRSLWPEPDGSFQQIAFEDSNALAWRTKVPVKAKWSLVIGVEVVMGSQMNLLLDRADAGFVSIAMVVGERPSVTLFDYDSKANTWDRIALVELEQFSRGASARIEVHLSTEHLKLILDGQPVIDVDVPGHDFRGPWGLGAQAGAAGIWKLHETPAMR